MATKHLPLVMLDNMSNYYCMTAPFDTEITSAPEAAGHQTICAACGRALCDHPDPIYGGIVPPYPHTCVREAISD